MSLEIKVQFEDEAEIKTFVDYTWERYMETSNIPDMNGYRNYIGNRCLELYLDFKRMQVYLAEAAGD